jgi:hypothetical protein
MPLQVEVQVARRPKQRGLPLQPVLGWECQTLKGLVVRSVNSRTILLKASGASR